MTTNPAAPFNVDILRLGWYAGAGGRLVAHLDSVPGVTQPACPSPGLTADSARECRWSSAFSLPITADYTSGVYVAVLTSQDHHQVGVPFVVRDPSRATALLYISPFMTYQAYNNYPNDAPTPQARPASGQSLYPDSSAVTAAAPAGQSAVRVSFDRPYAGPLGIGQFESFEPPLIQFLERNGYDVSYTADTDIAADPAELKRHRGIVLASHPEYSTRAMFDGVRNARDSGVNIASIAANELYWQSRLEPSSAGVARRVLVGYKATRPDPTTDQRQRTDTRFRSLGLPEQQILGSQYMGSSHIAAGGQALVPVSTTHWAFSGTGITEGTPLRGELSGYEINVNDPAGGVPPSTTFTTLMRSPFTGADGKPYTQTSTIYRAPSGAWVFESGSMAWAWGLTPGFGFRQSNNENPGLERMTHNILDVIAGVVTPP